MKGGIAVVDLDQNTWNEIKAKYIAGGTSYRKLADEYGLSESKISRRAKKEQWVELAAQNRRITDAKITDSISDSLSENAVNKLTLIDDIYTKALNQIKQKVATGKLKVYDLESCIRMTSKIGDQIGYKPKGDDDNGKITINIIRDDKGDD